MSVFKIMNYLNDIITNKHGLGDSIISWSKLYLRDFPWRFNRTPYRILIAEVLLRRTTSTAVNRIYSSFIDDYPNIKSINDAKTMSLEGRLKTLGYNRQRALILKNISHIIINKYKGNIPDTKNELLSIKHIGPYTSGAILSLSYNIKASMLDSNVKRIYNRLFLNTIKKIKIKNKLLCIADFLVPEKNFVLYNFGLLDIGAKICNYRIVLCHDCPMSIYCEYYYQQEA